MNGRPGRGESRGRPGCARSVDPRRGLEIAHSQCLPAHDTAGTHRNMTRTEHAPSHAPASDLLLAEPGPRSRAAEHHRDGPITLGAAEPIPTGLLQVSATKGPCRSVSPSTCSSWVPRASQPPPRAPPAPLLPPHKLDKDKLRLLGPRFTIGPPQGDQTRTWRWLQPDALSPISRC